MEGWERFPIRRQAGRESFSQVMFRSLLIPEAQSEGAANITMHQVLRLCYSDQRTPATRLFRFETFDTHSIREAVGDLLCGISGYEVYEIGLELRERKKELEIQARESRQLIRQKEGERRTARRESRRIRREHEKALSAFDLRYAGGNGPREAFLATRTGRLSHIEAEIDYLLKSRGPVARIAELMAEREELRGRCNRLGFAYQLAEGTLEVGVG